MSTFNLTVIILCLRHLHKMKLREAWIRIIIVRNLCTRHAHVSIVINTEHFYVFFKVGTGKTNYNVLLKHFRRLCVGLMKFP